MLGVLQDAVPIDSPSVILDANYHRRAIAGGGKFDSSFGRFAGPFPFLRFLDPVIDRVTQQVHEWFADLVQHGTVQFDPFAFDVQRHPLVELSPKVSDQAREAIEDMPNRRHPCLDDLFLQRTREVRHAEGHVFKFRIGSVGGKLDQPTTRGHQFPDEIHEIVEVL